MGYWTVFCINCIWLELGVHSELCIKTGEGYMGRR